LQAAIAAAQQGLSQYQAAVAAANDLLRRFE
jgi:hypothetical protein